MFMNKSQRSRRKKKSKNAGSERGKRDKTGGMEKSERKKKGKKKDQSERGARKKKVTESRDTTGTTGSGGCVGLVITGEGCSKMERREKAKEREKEKEKEQWSGDEMAKKMVASGAFDNSFIITAFKELHNEKPPLNSCISFKNNMQKVRAPEYPIPDDKIVKLTHAPDNFICAAKVAVPEFNRTMILSQVPDISAPVNIEDFWRMIFQEEVHSVVLALMPLECSVTLQQIFPILSGTFANHGKMFLNNRKVESTVAMTAYTLEILPDGCSNSLLTTVYHLHNWRQKRGLDNVGCLVSTLEKVLKTNENTVLMSMNGTGRAGTMLALFTSMLHVQKGKEVNTKEIVDKLRGERCGLIDNAEQYGTVYRAMALWFKNKSTDDEVQKKVNEFAPAIQ